MNLKTADSPAMPKPENKEHRTLTMNSSMNTPGSTVEAIQSGQRKMSHIEIAEIAGKRSDNVKRTISKLVAEGAISKPQIEELKTIQESGRITTTKQLMLGRLDSITVMAVINGRFCAELVKRWDELENGTTQPIKQQPANDPFILFKNKLDVSVYALNFAESWGLEGNQALLSADRMVINEIGFSPLTSMGRKALSAPIKELTYTPTELGRMHIPAISPVDMNLHLKDVGLQHKVEGQWEPTAQGEAFCEVLDFGKARSNGSPVKQVKWFKRVLDELDRYAPTTVEMPAIGAFNGSEQLELPEIPEGVEVLSDQTLPPYVPQKRKAGYSQQCKKGIDRYDLPNHWSISELADELNMSRKQVLSVLEKQQVIKWLERPQKYVLTKKGWQYGLMFDPTYEQFYETESGKMILSNARPVFTLDVIDLF